MIIRKHVHKNVNFSMMTCGGHGGGGTCMDPNSREPIHFCEKNTRFVVYNGGAEGGAHGGAFERGGPWGGLFSETWGAMEGP